MVKMQNYSRKQNVELEINSVWIYFCTGSLCEKLPAMHNFPKVVDYTLI